MNRLYQWLSGRASFFRSDTYSRTVRTEVTTERQGVILTLDGGAAVGFDTCPLCGSKLAPAQAREKGSRVLKGSISQQTGEGDSPPP